MGFSFKGVNMEKKLSVIVPCYNAVKWLPKCFISLVNQTMGVDNMELIFVNDASTDNGATWNMLKDMEKTYPESVIIIDLPENRRQGGARNEGLKYASGEYVGFADADDWVVDSLFEKAYSKAKETNADIVQFNHNLYFERIGIVPTQTEMLPEEFIIDNAEERKKFLISEKITYGCWNKIYRRELIGKAGVQFAEHVIYEEPLFVYPLLFYGSRFAIIPDRLYIYRQNSTGTMRNDMKAYDTLLQHASVQLAVWDFMKNTEYFKEYYEEIKLYFLHTYFYETLYFAKQRGMKITMELYKILEEVVFNEVKDIESTPYYAVIPKQMQLYCKAKQGMTEQSLQEYIKSL